MKKEKGMTIIQNLSFVSLTDASQSTPPSPTQKKKRGKPTMSSTVEQIAPRRTLPFRARQPIQFVIMNLGHARCLIQSSMVPALKNKATLTSPSSYCNLQHKPNFRPSRKLIPSPPSSSCHLSCFAMDIT